ncbi:tail fiber assembly protein [Achromobacter anxifer]
MALVWKNGGWYESTEGGYPVDPEYKAELMAGQVMEHYIATAEDGRPYLEKRPAPTIENLAQAARADRDELLRQSDWSQMPDVSESIRAAYVPYRQALRDITSQASFPADVAFPDKPKAN